MKRMICLLMAVAVIGSMAVYAEEPVAAEGEETDVTETTGDDLADGVQDVPDNITVAPNITVEPAPVDYEIFTEGTQVDLSLYLQPAAEDADPAEDAQTSTVFGVGELPAPDGLVGVVTQILGTYRPRTETVTEYPVTGDPVTYERVIPGLAGLDWEWICAVALFAIVLHGFMCCVGVLLKNG